MTKRDRDIRERAYHLWVDGGRHDGRSDEYWVAAERAIDAEAEAEHAGSHGSKTAGKSKLAEKSEKSKPDGKSKSAKAAPAEGKSGKSKGKVSETKSSGAKSGAKAAGKSKTSKPAG